MQASIKTEADGVVNWRLDPEAAQAVFASVVFASRFHEGITPLAVMAAARLHGDELPRRPKGEKSYASNQRRTRKEIEVARRV